MQEVCQYHHRDVRDLRYRNSGSLVVNAKGRRGVPNPINSGLMFMSSLANLAKKSNTINGPLFT
jgi:hypothetical protein